jgi:hypothetical protein
MQSLQDSIIQGHVLLSNIPLENSFHRPEADVERAREFPAQTGRCQLWVQAKALCLRYFPPPPPAWLAVMMGGWMIYCGLLKIAMHVWIGPEKALATLEGLFMQTA